MFMSGVPCCITRTTILHSDMRQKPCRCYVERRVQPCGIAPSIKEVQTRYPRFVGGIFAGPLLKAVQARSSPQGVCSGQPVPTTYCVVRVKSKLPEITTNRQQACCRPHDRFGMAPWRPQLQTLTTRESCFAQPLRFGRAVFPDQRDGRTCLQTLTCVTCQVVEPRFNRLVASRLCQRSTFVSPRGAGRRSIASRITTSCVITRKGGPCCQLDNVPASHVISDETCRRPFCPSQHKSHQHLLVASSSLHSSASGARSLYLSQSRFCCATCPALYNLSRDDV